MHHPKTKIPSSVRLNAHALVYLAGLLLLLIPMRARVEAAGNAKAREEATAKIQRVLDSLRARLEIASAVSVDVVEQNSLAFSVAAPKAQGDAFVISIEASYLELLSEEELEAALAHELGHVWIFTHHPYLQTELLANRIAMRTTPRESLAKVYEKLWSRLGAKGNLVEFLGRQ